MDQEILKYYDNLAHRYDEDRFSNTYGNYIHQQENKVLSRHFQNTNIDKNLDIACGTGRFLNYAGYGIDISPEMIKIATGKFPKKKVQVGNAAQLPFENDFFENAHTFHLFMHLKMDQIEKILSEVNRVLVKGGYFIFDIPSRKRRKITNYKADSWHGANHLDHMSVLQMTRKHWEIIAYRGIAFLPIHRIPKKIRKHFIRFDELMCKWFLKEWSSYLIFILKKK